MLSNLLFNNVLTLEENFSRKIRCEGKFSTRCESLLKTWDSSLKSAGKS